MIEFDNGDLLNHEKNYDRNRIDQRQEQVNWLVEKYRINLDRKVFI